jgi:hypothetical protein
MHYGIEAFVIPKEHGNGGPPPAPVKSIGHQEAKEKYHNINHVTRRSITGCSVRDQRLCGLYKFVAVRSNFFSAEKKSSFGPRAGSSVPPKSDSRFDPHIFFLVKKILFCLCIVNWHRFFAFLIFFSLAFLV